MSKPLEVFCCYAREDQKMLAQLKKHLAPLERQGQIMIWSDTNLTAGDEWEKDLQKHLESADTFLLLISPSFMDSDYCYGTEMKRAIKRHNEASAAVIPILLRPTFWQNAPFAELQLIPTEAKPVTKWPNRDDAFHHITEQINRIVSAFSSHQPPTDARTGLVDDPKHTELVSHRERTVRFTDEKNRQEIKTQRKQFCVPVLISIHEFAPLVATLREAHDNLWARQKIIFQADSYVKQINAVSKKANERAAVAGSELSIDPAGRAVMDALVEYLTAQNEYIQVILQPLRKIYTRFFGKTGKKIVDRLAKRADEKLTALEDAIRLYLDSL